MDDSRYQRRWEEWEPMERSSGGGEGGKAPGLRPAAALPYLEQDGNSVTEGMREWTEVRSCGCRSRFCEHCCLPLGLALKRRLLPELTKFTGLMMLTFTIDPELFTSPAEAFEYVTGHRCISVTMQRLFRWGLLHSRRYLWVVEWQKDTGQAHWHVLVDASFIPFEKLCEAWNRNWPEWEQRVALGRPGFGSVRFTVSKFKSPAKAAGYVTAYLTKHPKHGYPEWVLSTQTGRVHRFSTSRGFWSDGSGDDDEVSSYAATEDQVESEDEQEEEPEERRTVRQQLESCGKACAVLHVRQVIDQDTGELLERRKFEFALPVPLLEVLEGLPGLHPAVNKRQSVAAFSGSEALRARLMLKGLRNCS